MSVGVGLVAYCMSENDILRISKSLDLSSLEYKVVVDNSPTNSSQSLFEEYNWLYIHKPDNPGFGASHNIIFNRFSYLADYHSIINPDIFFTTDPFINLVNFLKENKDAGAVMPKVVYPSGKIQRLTKLLPTPIDVTIRRLPIKALQDLVNKRYEIHNADYFKGTYRVPFISGCFIVFKTKILKKIGFFDERYFMYFEDTDLCRRLWINSYYPYYYSFVKVKHGYEKGSAKSLKLFGIHIKSAIKYFLKWGFFDSERKNINKSCLKQFNNN